jgi:hypothetical protein
MCAALALPILAVAVSGCASSSPSAPASSSAPVPAGEVTTIRHVDKVTPPGPPPTLAGARCTAPLGDGVPQGACRCRKPGDDTESQPPADGQKRLEIRLSVLGGEGVLDSPTVGHFTASGVADTCYYVDVPAGSRSGWNFVARAANPDTGLSPRLTVSEYGPKGPYWYEIFSFDCVGVGGKCDHAGVDAWTARLKTRKRGRIDPCGSLVVTGLDWETTGGLAQRDTGVYRDFTVRFDVEVKKFPTQFAPNSTECVPK